MRAVHKHLIKISAQNVGQDSLPPLFFQRNIQFSYIRVHSKVLKCQRTSFKVQLTIHYLPFHIARYQLPEYFISTNTSAFKSYLWCAKSSTDTPPLRSKPTTAMQCAKSSDRGNPVPRHRIQPKWWREHGHQVDWSRWQRRVQGSAVCFSAAWSWAGLVTCAGWGDAEGKTF